MCHWVEIQRIAKGGSILTDAPAFRYWPDKLEVVLLLVIEVDDKSTHYCNSNEQSKLIPIT